ncbi:unnamed protein product [Orchesella dallaii]|uniref:Ionotropic receptor n=1 Tax=Orchesella dallaii TaxID=48710 RepID=A0ABP1RT06_9HEXA
MPASKIYILFFISSFFQASVAFKSLDLSINKLKYSVCTAYIDASPHHIHRTILVDVFYNIIEDNQKTLDLLWVIRTTAIQRFLVNTVVQANESNYVADRVKYSTKSCNIILTDMVQISSDPLLYIGHEIFYFYFWGSWLYGVAGDRNFPLNGKPTIVLALTYHRFWRVNPHHRDQAVTSPFSTFVLEYEKWSLFKIISCNWVCIHCSIDKKIFEVENPFNPTLTKFLLDGFPQPSFLDILQKRPVYVTELWPKLSSELTKTVCEFPLENLARNIFNNNLRDDSSDDNLCMQPNAVITTEMSRVLNFTMLYGGKINPVDYVYLFKGILLQVTAIKLFQETSLYNSMEWARGLDKMIMEDTAFWQCGYCEPNEKFSPHNIFKILGGSFDQYTWLAIGGNIILIFVFAKMAFLKQRISNTSDIFLEISSMLLQQGMIHSKGYKMAVIFTSFLLAFFYTDDVTGKMIAPPRPSLKETLTELLDGGYKINKQPFEEEEWRHVQFAEQLRLPLKGENFGGDIFSRNYWKNYTPDAVIQPETISQVMVTGIFQPQILIMKFGGRSNCHVLRKMYEVGQSYIRTFAINRNQISGVLQRLYFDSGIRLFFAQIFNQADIRAANRINVEYLEATVIALKLDDRILSLFLILIALLALSITIFFIEIFPVVRRTLDNVSITFEIRGKSNKVVVLGRDT